MEWNLSTDVVVIGAGAAGLAAAVSARDHGAAVVLVEENYDIGGHAMLSGGRVHLGGGNALQKKFNIKDSPDQIYADWTTYGRGDSQFWLFGFCLYYLGHTYFEFSLSPSAMRNAEGLVHLLQ